jgi:hypothetical protein
MTTTPKTIQDLTTTTSFIDTDFLVTSSSVTGNTTKIAKQPFIDALGNPVIDGYNCISSATDQYTLTPVSGNAVSQYYNHMTVGFVGFSDSTGNAQIRIANLAFKNFYQYNTAITVDVIEGEYYEAVYIDGAFYQTNAQVIGQPTLMGYNSSAAIADQISLASINGISIGTYRNNLKVCFISPITSIGNVTMQIDGLALRNFYQYDTTNAVELEIGKYYEAIYVGDASSGIFYLTNAKTATLFSNEYIAVGTVAVDELSTTYQLTSAIGAAKTGYYPAMSLLFTADISSKGVVFINVDGLGDKVLGEGTNDPIANNLYAGQPLLATYDSVTGEFNKHRFAVTNPPAPPIDPDLPIPDENLVDINVGASRPIKTITNAIKALVGEFGNDGGNRLATIHLDGDFVWTELVSIASDIDYSWITITNSTVININNNSTFAMTISERSLSPVITGTYQCNGTHSSTFEGSGSGLYIVKDATFTSTTDKILFRVDNINATNLNTTGFQYIVNKSVAGSRSNIKLENCTLLDSTIMTIRSINCDVDIINTTIDCTTIYGEPVILLKNCIFGMTDSTIKGAIQVVTLQENTGFNLTNCRINSITNSQIGLRCMSGATGIVDGGDYRTNDNSVVATNIVADGTGTVIRLVNSPLGGTSAINSGQIVII